MDNLTHSLIGAVLGQAGLKRRTGLAMPALIIAANLPDLDAPCTFYGVQSLAMRRGITHGPIAGLLLPLALAGLLILYDRWQAKRGTRPESRLPVRPGWLLALCYLGWATHLLFDWFNNYGIRLLEPFSSRWFHGDTLFIIDVWIWAMLGLGVWLSLRRERAGRANWRLPARAAAGGVAAYVLVNMAISSITVTQAKADVPYPDMAVANAVPVAFWRREVLWRSQDALYGMLPCTALGCTRYPMTVRKTNMADPRIAAWSAQNADARAFLFWSRMPVAEVSADRIVLRDQRFMQAEGRGPFRVELKAP